MTFVTWNEKLLTGIREIDHDHKMLFDLIEQFHEAYMSTDSKAAMEPAFRMLMDYTENHFRREEELLEKVGYPGQAGHHQDHEDLKDEVLALYQRFQNDKLRGVENDLGLELLSFLKNWLEFHILEDDMKYVEFIRDKEKH